MGKLLGQKLQTAGWEIINQTRLPLLCFVDGRSKDGRSLEYLQGIADRVVRSGKAWISVCRLAGGLSALRACITSYRTTADDLDELVDALETARQASIAS